jgi:hypothetical protein
MSSDPKATTKKKPYHKPTLKVYGSIHALTTTTSNNSIQGDGGAGAFNKTH